MPWDRIRPRISTGSPWVATLDDGSAESTATLWISWGARPRMNVAIFEPLPVLSLATWSSPSAGRSGFQDGAGQVGQDVDDVHRPVALGDRRVDLAHRGIERPVDRIGSSSRRSASGPPRAASPIGTPGSAESTTKTRLESGSLATISLARSLASSSRVLSLSLYSIDRLVSNTRPSAVGCDSSPSGTSRIEPRPRQGQRHQGQDRHPRQQQQPVLDPHPLLRLLLPFADQPQRRENDVLGRLPHEQVQDDRQRRQRRPRRQSRMHQRHFHGLSSTPSSPGLPREQIAHQGLVERHPRVQRNVVDASADAVVACTWRETWRPHRDSRP